MHYSLIKSACNDFIVFQSFVKIQRAFEFINKLIVNLRTLFNLTALNNLTCLHLSARSDKLKDRFNLVNSDDQIMKNFIIRIFISE